MSKLTKPVYIAGMVVILIIMVGFCNIYGQVSNPEIATVWVSTDGDFKSDSQGYGPYIERTTSLASRGTDNIAIVTSPCVGLSGKNAIECGGIVDAVFDYNTASATDEFIFDGYFLWQSQVHDNTFGVYFEEHQLRQGLGPSNFGITSPEDGISIRFYRHLGTSNLFVRSHTNNNVVETKVIQGIQTTLKWGNGNVDGSGNVAGDWNHIQVLVSSGTFSVDLNGRRLATISHSFTIKQIGIEMSKYGLEHYTNYRFGNSWVDDLIIHRTSDVGTFSWASGQKPGTDYDVFSGNTRSVEVNFHNSLSTDMSCDGTCSAYWSASDSLGSSISNLKAVATLGTQIYKLTFNWLPTSAGSLTLTITASEPGVQTVTETLTLAVLSASGSEPTITAIEWDHPPYFQDRPILVGTLGTLITNEGTNSGFDITAKPDTGKSLTRIELICDEQAAITQSVSGSEATATLTCQSEPEVRIGISVYDDGGGKNSKSYFIKREAPDILVVISAPSEMVQDVTKEITVTYTVIGHHESISLSYEVEGAVELKDSVETDVYEDVYDDGTHNKYSKKFTIEATGEGDYTITGRALSMQIFEGFKGGEVVTARSTISTFFDTYWLLIAGIIAGIVIYFVLPVQLPKATDEWARLAALVGVVAVIVLGVIRAFVPEGLGRTQAYFIVAGAGVVFGGFLIRSKTDIEETSETGNLFTIGVIVIGGVIIALGVFLGLILQHIWTSIALMFLLVGVGLQYFVSKSDSQGSDIALIPIILGVVLFVFAALGVFDPVSDVSFGQTAYGW